MPVKENFDEDMIPTKKHANVSNWKTDILYPISITSARLTISANKYSGVKDSNH